MDRLATFARRIAVRSLALAVLTTLGIPGILHAQNSTSQIQLRHAVAVSGDYAVVGAQWENGFRGQARVLEREGDRWVEVQALAPSDLGRYDHFGASVSIDGDRIVVGAPWRDMLRGEAFVFRRVGDLWVEQERVASSEVLPEDGMAAFAQSDAAMDAEAFAVGAYGAPPLATSAVPDPPDFVSATDGVFEDKTEVSWTSVDEDAIIYKVLRDNVLISVVSSEDSMYVDETGARGVVYDYCVVVEDMLGVESAPQCDSGSRIIFPPAELSASDGDFIDGVSISWDDRSAVEAGYYLRRDGTPIDTLGPNSQFATDTSAVPLTSYNYELVAFDSDGNESAARTDTGFRGVVLPPLNVSASDGEYAGSVVINWEDQSSDDDFFVVSRKNLATMDSTVLDTTAANATSYTDPTAQQGIRYLYCVTTLDGVGQLSISVCDEGGIDMPVPANVAASDSTYDDMVEITWDDVSGLEDGYEISRDGTVIDTTAANASSYRDMDATPDVTHNYCVVALSNNGGASAPACDDGFRIVVLAPTDVSATDGQYEDRVVLRWQSTATTVVLFKIFRDATFIKSVGPGTRSYADAGGTADAPYVYSVQAVTALAEVSVAVPDAGHRELRSPSAVAASDDDFEDRVEVLWADNSQFESGYAIYRAEVGGGLPAALVGEVGAGVATFVDRTGAPGVTYRYSVAAFDTDGEARGESATSSDEGRRVIEAPRRVSASDGDFEDRVEITWEDRSNVEDGYHIYRDGLLIATTADNTTSVFDDNPIFGIPAEYAVSAFDAWGSSSEEADTGFTTIFAPVSFNASDTYSGEVVLRWVDASEVEDGYILTTDSAGVTVRVDTTAANATSYTDRSAELNRQYEYSLQAFVGGVASTEASDGGMSFFAEQSTPGVLMDTKLDRTNIVANDRFGTSVSTEGDYLVVGNPRNVGFAYFFERNPDLSWSQVDRVQADDASGGDRFGEAVDMSGDLAVIGLPGRDSDYQNQTGRSGLALIFQRNPDDGTWSEWEVLRPIGEQEPDFDPEDSLDEFGSALSVDGLTAVIGARGDGTGSGGSAVHDLGSVYFFVSNGGSNWGLDQTYGKHFASDGEAEDAFGTAVGLSGDWAIAGAPGDDDQGADAGSAYIFRRTGTEQWEEFQKLTGPFTSGAAFGSAVAIAGDVAFVGAPGTQGQPNPGRVYIFRYDPGDDVWVEQQSLRAGGDALAYDGFGAALDVHGSRVIVGSSEVGSESAWVLIGDALGNWAMAGRLGAADGEVNDYFGRAVAIGDEWAFVGAPGDDIGQLSNVGSVNSLLFLATVSNVRASDGSFGDRVHIEWDDRSQSEEGIIVYRDGVEYDRLGSNEDFYDDFDAEPGRTYEYQIEAINQFAGFESERVPDFGYRPPDGHITGRISAPTGSGVEGVAVCLEPPGTGALLFDGAGGHVRVPDDGTFDFSVSENFTIEVWFSYAGNDRSPRIISKLPATGTEERPLDLGLQRTGRVYFTMSDGNNVARVLSQRGGLNDDTWHHIACVHDATTQELRMYVDGVLEATESTASLGDITNRSDVFIGGIGSTTWFGGQVDELRIWDSPRTEAEIQASMVLPMQGDEPSLLGYWPFDAVSGRSITDFAGIAQYGRFEGGVYRTPAAAPLDVCTNTDSEGNFVLTRVRYNKTGTDFRVRPTLERHQYSPAVQLVTLNSGHPVENQVNFTDVSSYTLSGRVQFADSDCFEEQVEILVDGISAGMSDKNGKFAVTTDEGTHTIGAVAGNYAFVTVVDGDTSLTHEVTLDVLDDVPNIYFVNTTRHTVSGKAGGGCDHYVGDITIRYRSETSCLDTSFVQVPDYSIDLPPLKYFASASVDPATIPAGLPQSDVIAFFQSLGEREIDLTVVPDTTLDFIYRAPLQVVISGFEPYVDPNCSQLVLEDGTPLPEDLPIVPQLEEVFLTIRVSELYPGSVCPLDTGMVVITDEIFDREDTPDTLMVIDGEAQYRTFASTPSLIAGRTDGPNDRSYQKALTATAVVDGRDPVSSTEWVLVTGRVAPAGAEFVTYTANMPLHILRDPPGDGSSAFLERGFTASIKAGLETSLTLETGVELKTEFGFKPETFVWFGVPITGGGGEATLENKFIIGSTVTANLETEIRLSTTDRFSTSSNEALIGEDGDVYIGTGVNFLFTEAGTIEVDGNCQVVRGTTVAFEPDSIRTAYAYTETHIRDVLIPELESKAIFYADSLYGEVFEAQAENWQDIVDRNREFKKNGLTLRNRSFSAGAEHEHTNEGAVSASASGSIKLFASLENKLGGDTEFNIFGAKAKLTFAGILNIRTEVTASAGVTGEATEAVGYVLSDDDLGDNFSVDIKYGGRYITPMFDVRAGKSSCPYEPWNDLETGEASMVARDRPFLFVTPPTGVYNNPPEEPAELKITIANDSDEVRDYVVSSVSVSNPGGAILRLNGSPIANGLSFTVAPGTAHEATLTVERGPTRFYYEGLQLVVAPACGDPGIEDVVTFDVGFATACSDIVLLRPEPGWSYNHANENAGDTVDMILTDYEVLVSPNDSLRVTAVGVQYRHLGVDNQGPGPWTDVFADSVGSVETLLAWDPAPELVDGVYELRAFALCNSGGRGYSGVSTGSIDRSAPVVFGSPQPSDGELSLGEDISITFNEPVDCASVDGDSVTLVYMDGPSTGSRVDINVACNGSSLVITPLTDPNDLEGRQLTATVGGVRDLAGNPMGAPVTWAFEFRRSLFTWSETQLSRNVPLGQPGSIATQLANGTSQAVGFAVTDVPPFLMVMPSDASGTIAPGATRTIAFDVERTIAAGVHQGQVRAIATDSTGTDTTSVAVFDVYLEVACVTPDWTVNPNNFEYTMSIVGRMTVDGTGATLNDPKDRIAAFVGRELRGVTGPVDAAGDTLVFLTVYSNRAANETIRFEIWDDNECKRYGGTVERYPFSADSVLGNPALPATFSAVEVLPGTIGEFALESGWNWFSTNIASADMSVSGVLSTLTPSAGDMIKSKTSFAMFDPAAPSGWVGSLTAIDNTSGYMIRLTDPGTIYHEGTPVDPTVTPIPVESGWSWIAYAGNSSNSVAAALGNLGGQGFLNGSEVIKSQEAFAQWDLGWVGNLTSMQPGEGYRLFLQSGPLPGSFTYPANTAAATLIAGVGPGEDLPEESAPKWSVEANRYEHNMTVIAAIETGDREWNRDDFTVGAFVGDECRGVVRAMHVEGIDRTLAFVMIHGNSVDGEVIEFRAFDESSDLTYDVVGSMPFEADATWGMASDPMMLATGTVRDGIPSGFRLVQNHPNPFNPTTTIRFELPSASAVTLTIYNVRGQLVRTLVQQEYGAGRHDVVWDGTTARGTAASSGVYFYRITAGSFTEVKKMVLLK